MSALNFFGMPAEIAWCTLTFAIGVLGLGMDLGDRDRRMPYSYAAIDHMHCGKHTIISSIGNRFISVTPDNRHHIINDECKVQFDFEQDTIIPTASMCELLKAKFVSSVPSKPLASSVANPPVSANSQGQTNKH